MESYRWELLSHNVWTLILKNYEEKKKVNIIFTLKTHQISQNRCLGDCVNMVVLTAVYSYDRFPFDVERKPASNASDCGRYRLSKFRLWSLWSVPRRVEETYGSIALEREGKRGVKAGSTSPLAPSAATGDNYRSSPVTGTRGLWVWEAGANIADAHPSCL